MGTTVNAARAAVRDGAADEVVVVANGCNDGTAGVAKGAGARVIDVDGIPNELGRCDGKGDAIWRALPFLSADFLLLFDADIVNVSPDHFHLLAEALRGEDSPILVKAAFTRIDHAGSPVELGGGRVTEFVARPLLRLIDPNLASLGQPLGGQVVVNRQVLARASICTGYGFEVSLLMDIFRDYGRRSLVEVSIGLIQNRSKTDRRLLTVADDVAGALADRIAGRHISHLAYRPPLVPGTTVAQA